MVTVDVNGDLIVTPPAGRAVLVQGVDVPAALAGLDGRLGALEIKLQIALARMPTPPTGPPPLTPGQVPRIGQDLLGNLLLIPAPNRTVVMAGVRVLDLLTRAGERLATVEGRLYGLGIMPNVTSVPSATSPFLPRPGTVGLGADGSLRIEPLAGRTVLTAGRDMVLELHRITARLNLTEQAMAACPCLAPPATCRVCNAGGCNFTSFSSSSPASFSFTCLCNRGWTGPGCREALGACAAGSHNCSRAATCTEVAGSASFTCTCNAGFTGNGTFCAVNPVLWVQQVGSALLDGEGAVAMDDAGRVFLAGWVSGPVDGLLFAGGACDALLVAFNGSTGSRLWSRMLGSSGNEQGLGVATDSIGGVYVTGHTEGSLDGQSNAGESDAFLARFDASSGTRLWTLLLGTAVFDASYAVAVDRVGTNDVVIGGSTRATFSPGLAGGQGGIFDAFLARYTSGGTRVWVRQFGSSGLDVVQRITIFRSDIYVTGFTSVSDVANNDILVAKYSGLGSEIWTVRLFTAVSGFGFGIAADGSGVYVAGATAGALDNKPYNGGAYDGFVAKFALNGTLVWTRMLGTSSDDRAYSAALDGSSGSVLVTGFTGGALGGQANAGGQDAFVASFASNGTLQWTRLLGSAAPDSGNSIALDSRSGVAYVAGQTGGSMFGQPRIGDDDLFLLKLQYACAAGFTSVGVTCANVDECVTGAHNCNAASAACLDTAGSFTCACNAGFTGNGTVCSLADMVTVPWVRQAGSNANDGEGVVAVDGAGRVFLAGRVAGPAEGFSFSGGIYDVLLVAYNSSTGVKLWSQVLGTRSDDYSFDVAADSAGGVYVTGITSGNGLDGQAGAGGNDILLARYDSSNGTRTWTRLLGTVSNDVAISVAVDRSIPDAVFLGGYTENTTGAGLPGSLGSGFGGPRDAFVARFASNGTRVWVRPFGSGGDEYCYGVAVHDTEIYATGYTSGNMAAAANAGGYDIFVARITALGAVVWTAQLGSAGNDHSQGIAVDSSGVYVAGYAGGSLNGQPYAGSDDVFVARYTHAGAWSWTAMLGSSSSDIGRSVALDRGSNVLVTGYTYGALGGQAGAGINDIFVASFTSGGALQWTRLYGTKFSDYGFSVAVDGNSSVAYVAGQTGGSMFGQPIIGSDDLFVLKLQYACAAGFTGDGVTCANVDECATGVHNCNASSTICLDTVGSFTCALSAVAWARQAGSAVTDNDVRVAVDDAGRVFLAGLVGGVADGLAFAGGPFDVYLAAYSGGTGARLWSQTFGTTGNDVCYGVAADGAGSVFVVGSTSGSLDGQANAGGQDLILLRFDSGSGFRIWARLLGSAGVDIGYGVAIDLASGADDIYVGGAAGNTSAGGGLPGSTGGFGGPSDGFVARYAGNGTRVWVRQLGSSGGDLCHSIAVYQSEVYVVGYTDGAIAGFASAGGLDIFLAKISAAGVMAWIVQLGSDGDDFGRGIAVDSSGVFASGLAGGSISGQPFRGASDALVVRYSHAGAWVWTRLLGTEMIDNGVSIALDRGGRVLVAGSTGGALGGRTSIGSWDVFVASLTASGVLQWVRLVGTVESDFGHSIAMDSKEGGSAYVAGVTAGAMYGQPAIGGAWDLFVLKLQYACATGFTGDGVTCANVDECATGVHTCNASSATCLDTAGSFTCACNAGFTGSGRSCALDMVVWARQTGSVRSDTNGHVAVDGAGRVFLVGWVSGEADGFPFSGGSYDVFLTAYNSSTGVKLWSQMLGSNGSDYSWDLATDGVGNVYVTGWTGVDSSLDGQANAGSDDVFLVRFDGSNGNKSWTRLLGGAGVDVGFGVSVDPSNPDAIVISGYTASTAGSGLPGSAGGFGGDADAFVARYASNGTRVWVRQLGSGGDDRCYCVAIYQSDIYVTGITSGAMVGRPNAGGIDLFVARITAQGAVAWTAQLGSSGSDYSVGVAVDASGVYVGGYADGSLSGEPFQGAWDVLVARYTHAGAWVWTRMLGSNESDIGYAVALDSGSNVLVTGHTLGMLGGQANFGRDVFVASFTSGGVLQWTRLYGTASIDNSNSIALDPGGSAVFVAGNTDGSMYGHPTVGGQDLSLLKLRYTCATTSTGTACANVNECAAGTHSCNATSATCSDTAGSFTCVCNAGFVGNGKACALVSIPNNRSDTGLVLQWARQTGSIDGDTSGHVVVDSAGRVYLAGAVSGSVDGLAFAQGHDLYLAAFSSNGTKLWSQMLGSNSFDFGQNLAEDGAGSLYVSGYTNGVSLDGQVGTGTNDVMLVRYNSSSGARMWTRLFGAAGSDIGYGVAVDRNNSDAIYVGGQTGSATGGGLPGSTGGLGGSFDAIVARFAANGSRVWVRHLGSSGDDVCNSIAVFQSDIYATGFTSGATGNATNAGNNDVFLARITGLGVVVWTAQMGTGGDDRGEDIAVDSSGVYVTGQAPGSLDGQPFVGSFDMFVARFTHAGARVWTRMLGSTAGDFGRSILLDRGVLVTGYTQGSLSGQNSSGKFDMFVASFSSSGLLQWTQPFGAASSHDYGWSIAADSSSGTVYVAGRSDGPLYGQPSFGNEDLVVLKLQYACGAGLTGDGVACVNVNECAAGTHTCNASSATCTDTLGSFLCACNAGFVGNGTLCTPIVIPALQWARQAGSANSDASGRVALDGAGSVFLAGYVGGSADGGVFAGGAYDAFLIAYIGSTGAKLWSQMLGSDGDDVGQGMAADGIGSVYVTGWSSSVSLYGQPNAGSWDVFLVRCASGTGARIWTRLLGTASSDYGQSVAVDRSNPDAVYVGGRTESTVGIGLPGSGGGVGGSSDAFVARYAANGTLAWVRQFGSGNADECTGMAVFLSDIYVTGSTDGVMAGAASAGRNDVFVAKVTALGAVAWTAQLGSVDDDYGRGIAVDGSGVYLTGYAGGSFQAQQPLAGDVDAFVAQYTHAGVLVWTQMLGSPASDMGLSLVPDRGSVLVAGYTNDALGGQASAGGRDVFVASFSGSSGGLQWTRLYGTAAADFGNSIALDAGSGALYVAGNTGGSMYGQPSAGGNSDLFLLKLQ